MTVITEDELRKKVLSKELYEGMDFVIPSGSLLTPAAKSYLREHHITSVTTGTQKRVDSCPIRTPSIETKLLSRNIEYEIQHLKHLLYFPMLRDDTFPAELWLYFEKQQAWLENIIQGKFLVIEQAIDQEQVVLESSQLRQWDYSSKEIQLQLNKILFLFEEQSDRRYQYFQEWADALIQTMTVVKLN
ncbi:hypothetical protein IGI96_003761 [Enterococcus sp. DIV0421]|uniref:hypothetical protein n=1 Tax=Enterococcus sp. DIV0421 TaxID=2774688 RepID=UPI003F2819ED